MGELISMAGPFVLLFIRENKLCAFKGIVPGLLHLFSEICICPIGIGICIAVCKYKHGSPVCSVFIVTGKPGNIVRRISEACRLVIIRRDNDLSCFLGLYKL